MGTSHGLIRIPPIVVVTLFLMLAASCATGVPKPAATAGTPQISWVLMYGDRDDADREFACQSGPRPECVVPASKPDAPVFSDIHFYFHAGALRVIHGRPSTLIGIPYDRPVVGYGGETVNTLRLWSAATPDYFDFHQFSGGDFVGALAERLTAETLTRVLYPDDSTSQGKGLRFLQQYFLVACTLADAIRRFRAAGNDWLVLPEKVAIQLNDTHPTLAVPELMRILLDDAKLDWDQAWDLTQRTLGYTNHTLLPEALEKWPLPWRFRRPRRADCAYPSG